MRDSVSFLRAPQHHPPVTLKQRANRALAYHPPAHNSIAGSRATVLVVHQNLLPLEECLALHHHQQNNISSSSTSSLLMGGSGANTNVRFVDGSWFHKGPRNGRAEFHDGPRIAGAVYFDLEDIAGQGDLFPLQNPDRLSHRQPPPQLFAAYMDASGMTRDDIVIIYGSAGCAFLPRVWFTFRHVMGHPRVYLMQGSLQEWMERGGPVEVTPLVLDRDEEDPGATTTAATVWAKDLDWSSTNTRYQVPHHYNSNNKLIVDRHEMKDIVMQILQAQQQNQTDNANVPSSSQRTLILDPRGSSFAKGHMPGAIHVPYASLSEPSNPNRLKSVSALRELLRDVIHDDNPEPDGNHSGGTNGTRLVLSCGSGVSVCNLYLALEECGYTAQMNTVVYDGSWEEWRMYDDLPKIVPTSSTVAASKNTSRSN